MRIEADWRRFECGLWGYKAGDISNAYSADRKDSIRTPFVHAGHNYTSMGGGGSAFIRAVHTCHLLLPFYEGTPAKVQYSHEGEVVKWKGKPFRLGPKVEFIATERTAAEAQKYLRAMYQNGGAFTSEKTYHDLLREWCDDERWCSDARAYVPLVSGQLAIAIGRELAKPDFTKHKTGEPIILTDEDNQQAMLFAGLA